MSPICGGLQTYVAPLAMDSLKAIAPLAADLCRAFVMQTLAVVTRPKGAMSTLHGAAMPSRRS